MQRILFICFFLSSGFFLYSFASNDYYKIGSKNAGSKYFPFLKLNYDARAEAMGGASIGMPNGLYSVFSNPAELSQLNKMGLMVSYQPIILDIRSGALAYVNPNGFYGVWAANLMYISYGTFETIYDENKNIIPGSIDPYSFEGGISWSKLILPSLSIGITGKWIFDRLCEKIDNYLDEASANGMAIDFGLQYRLQSSKLIYGLVLKNIGFVRSNYWDETDENGLPFTLCTGFSYVFRNFPRVRIAVDLEKAIDDFLQYQTGLELSVYRQNIFLRAGYDFSHNDLKNFIRMVKNSATDDTYQKANWSLLSMGTGIKTKVENIDFNLDLALKLRVDLLRPNFIVSLMTNF